MKFDREYKDEMDLLSPSEEQIEKIKKNVYERIERENSEFVNAPKPHKKPLKIKIAAISGAACACAAALAVIVIGSRGALKVPLMQSGNANFIKDSTQAEGILNYGTNAAPSHSAGGLSGGFSADTDLGEDDGLANDKTGDATVGANASSESLNPCSETLPSTQSAAPGTAEIPYLSFSNGKKSCTVTLGGKELTYKKSESFLSAECDCKDLGSGGLQAASSNLGSKLLVRFDENDLYVFDESGEFLGHYTLD